MAGIGASPFSSSAFCQEGQRPLQKSEVLQLATTEAGTGPPRCWNRLWQMLAPAIAGLQAGRLPPDDCCNRRPAVLEAASRLAGIGALACASQRSCNPTTPVRDRCSARSCNRQGAELQPAVADAGTVVVDCWNRRRRLLQPASTYAGTITGDC